MKLFETGKIGCFLDGVGHGIEKRRGEEVKVLKLRLRVSPFDAQLAAAMPDGIKPTLFKIGNGEPKDSLKRVDFKLPNLDRQVLTVFASPDTVEPSIALDQAKVDGIYARIAKDRTDFDLVFRATFGPVGKAELSAVQDWLLSQRFLSFEESEPLLEMEDDGEDDAPAPAARPAPTFDDVPAETPATREAKRNVDTARKPMRRHTDPKHAATAKQKARRARA